MKRILQINIIALMMLLFLSPVNALNDGAYLISRSTSYVNPLTGKTEDGGENIALGDSMVGNIVEGQLLLEQTGGKYYITVGLGLASNVSNVRFKVMTSSGAMSSVSATKTGSSSANGDTVNHYRIQVSSLDIYISPIMYVSPMGRNVQFFIKPNISSAISGTGVYNSQMIPQSQAPTTSTENQSSTTTQSSTPTQKTQEETTPESVENTEAPKATVGTITKESLMENATGLSNHLVNSKGKVDTKLKLTTKNIKKKNQKEQKASSHYSLWIIGVLGVIVVGGVVYVKKKLKNSFIFICLISLLTGCVNQNQEVQTSEEVTIAATSVSITEILDQLDVPAKQVVGIPQSDSYSVPKKYKKATQLGNAMSPDMEKLSTLKPDLILSPNSLEGDLASKYEKIKISSSFLNLKSLSGMYKSIEELGKFFNKEKKAQKLIDDYTNYMISFREKYQNNVSPRVLILMGLPGGSYVVATESSYVGDLVKLAGGTNIYGDGNGEDFVNVSVEDMLKQNPDLILRTSHAMPEKVMAYFQEEFSNNETWQQFDAVKNNKVFDLNHEYFGMSANFNYQKGLEDLEGILYENH